MKGLKNISYLIVRKRWFFLVIIIFIMDNIFREITMKIYKNEYEKNLINS